MAEYIEREAALNALGQFKRGFRHMEERCAIDGCMLEIMTVYPADVVEIKRGRWIKNAWRDSCSICGFSGSIFDEPIHPYNFCPNCGADMRED